MSETDEVGEDLDRALRVTLTAAGQVGETLARRSADRQREAAAASREDGERMHRELTGQRDAARLVHRQAGDARWWDSARPQDVGAVWEAAQAWKNLDPQAAAAADLVRAGVARKWGRDVDDLVDGLTDAAAARHERQDAQVDREQAQRLEDVGRNQDVTVGPGAGADERDLATSHREAAEAHDQQAAHQVGDFVAATAAATGERPYARARADEVGQAPPAAAAARLEAAQPFPMSTRAALHTKTSPRARATHAPAATATRDHDLGR